MTAKVPDTFNASDNRLGLGGFQLGIVVDDNDPTQTGRYKIRILGEQDDPKLEQVLPWIPCMTNNQPQLRQVGKYPAGNYCIGSTVVLANMGQQGWIVLGATTNNLEDSKTQDSHRESRSKSPLKIIDALGNTFNRLIAGLPAINKLVAGKGLTPSTKTAYDIINGRLPTIDFSGDPISTILSQAKTEAKYKLRPDILVKAGQFQSFANFAFNQLDMKNPTKEVARISQELIPNAVSMIEQLKKTGSLGQNILASASVGGVQNIVGALAGIASLINALKNKDNDKDNQDLLEEELRKLYKQLFNKEPLNEFGKETAQYTKWKQAYLNGELQYE